MNAKSDELDSNDHGSAIEAPPWLRASVDDVAVVDFEAPLIAATAADNHKICELYQSALSSIDGAKSSEDTASVRVFQLLLAVCGMRFIPQERDAPFGPMLVLSQGCSTL